MLIRSGTSHLRLMLIDAARRTHIGRLLPRLERSQWKSTAELESRQLAKLNRLLDYAADQIPHYRQILVDSGLGAERRRLVSFDDLNRLPVLTKQELRRAPEDFRPSEKAAGHYQIRKTGGSTGAPLIYRIGVGALSGQWAAIFRAWKWAGYRLGDSMATLGGGSVGTSVRRGYSERIYHALRNNAPIDCSTLTPAGLTGIASRLQALRPELVYGYPSILYQVARHLLDRGDYTPTAKALITTSEMLFPGQRRLLEDAFGIPVFDFYGCNEPDLITGECRHHDGYHVAMESAHVEILDDQDRPLPDGRVGRIIATGLDNRAQVFLRYDTGDLGSLDRSPCRCGRGLIRLKSIQGRSRDLIRRPDGSLIHGVAFNQLVLGFSWIDRYQVIQESEQRLVTNIACSAAVSEEEKDRFKAGITELAGLEPEILFNQPFRKTSGQKTRVLISDLETVNDQ